MIETPIKISVIIVSYKCLPVLRMSLSCLQIALNNICSETILVDNASNDGTAEFIRQHYSWVDLIASSTNDGFAIANNRAIAKAKGEIVVLLNPDTIVPHTFATDIIEHFAKHPQNGALGINMINGKGLYLRESKRGYPYLHTSFFKLTSLWRLMPNSAYFNSYYIGNQSADSICEAPILSGACMAFSNKLIKRIGAFDETYFMYGEDIDLSWRLHTNSNGNLYNGNISIVHFKGLCTPNEVKYIVHFYNAMLKFAKKYEFTKHNILTNLLVSLGIQTGRIIASARCLLLKIEWRKSRIYKYRPKHIYIISNNHFDITISNLKCQTAKIDDIKNIAASHQTAILFDITNNLNLAFDIIKTRCGQFTYGFFNPKNMQTIITTNNDCESL